MFTFAETCSFGLITGSICFGLFQSFIQSIYLMYRVSLSSKRSLFMFFLLLLNLTARSENIQMEFQLMNVLIFPNYDWDQCYKYLCQADL